MSPPDIPCFFLRGGPLFFLVDYLPSSFKNFPLIILPLRGFPGSPFLRIRSRRGFEPPSHLPLQMTSFSTADGRPLSLCTCIFSKLPPLTRSAQLLFFPATVTYIYPSPPPQGTPPFFFPSERPVLFFFLLGIAPSCKSF